MRDVGTIIIEPRMLVREALVSLIAGHSDQVICGVSSTADIVNSSTAAEAPKLVLLGALPAEDAAREANSIRKVWPKAKIILLFEHASPAEFQKLLTSEIDGCIPLAVSPDTLISTLRLIIVKDLRILVVRSENDPAVPRFTKRQEEPDKSEMSTNKLRPTRADYEAIAGSTFALPLPIGEILESEDARNGGTHTGSSFRTLETLSAREEQILKGLQKGQSNKMIARTCSVTEATIKLHMKSILRKVRVKNRTQAAIWAVQRYYADALKDQKASRGTEGEASTS